MFSAITDHVHRAMQHRLQLLLDPDKCKHVGIHQFNHDINVTLTAEFDRACRARSPRRTIHRTRHAGLVETSRAFAGCFARHETLRMPGADRSMPPADQRISFGRVKAARCSATSPPSLQVGKLVTRKLHPDRPAPLRFPADEPLLFQSHGSSNARWVGRLASNALCPLLRCATVELGVVVDEGEVLALSFCVFGHLCCRLLQARKSLSLDGEELRLELADFVSDLGVRFSCLAISFANAQPRNPGSCSSLGSRAYQSEIP